jgi:hypothetical protein
MCFKAEADQQRKHLTNGIRAAGVKEYAQRFRQATKSGFLVGRGPSPKVTDGIIATGVKNYVKPIRRATKRRVGLSRLWHI